MDMDERQLVAMDIGTSKIALTVAKVAGDNVQIIYYRETPSAGIRYSRVINPSKASGAIRQAIGAAEEELGIRITDVIVGLPKYDVQQNTAPLDVKRDAETCISQEEINEIKESALTTYPLSNKDSEILFGAVAQSFGDEDNIQISENDIIGKQSLNAEYDRLTAKRDSIYAQYIKENPNDLTSGYLTLFMDPAKGLDSYNLLGSTVKESAMGELLDMVAKSFTDIVIREKNKMNIQPGKPAPDFSLKGTDGKEYTLASFKGKYMLLDFWGEWCYWCMKGMPDMKKYYEKYKDQIEFVGINCRDSEETWQKTVREEGLVWTNLFNGDDTGLLNKYAVEGFPTKILIDKEGKIVEVFVGESEDLYTKLDELF